LIGYFFVTESLSGQIEAKDSYQSQAGVKAANICKELKEHCLIGGAKGDFDPMNMNF